MRDTERDTETQAEGEAGPLMRNLIPGPRGHTLSWRQTWTPGAPGSLFGIFTADVAPRVSLLPLSMFSWLCQPVVPVVSPPRSPLSCYLLHRHLVPRSRLGPCGAPLRLRCRDPSG